MSRIGGNARGLDNGLFWGLGFGGFLFWLWAFWGFRFWALGILGLWVLGFQGLGEVLGFQLSGSCFFWVRVWGLGLS